MYTLLIDTSQSTETVVGLRMNGKEDIVTAAGNRQTQQVLPLIDTLLQKHGLTVKNLTNIEVNLGPGSFTGLRVGVSIANTLAQSLRIPINNGIPGELVQPIYS